MKSSLHHIVIGADNRGEEVAQHIASILTGDGHNAYLVNATDQPGNRPFDYPDEAWNVGTLIARGEADSGILISGSGIGMCMCANKIHGIRAVIGHDEWIVRRSRVHHDCNVLCIPADMVGLPYVRTIIDTWIKTPFDGGRHERRVQKIAMVECGEDPADHCEAAGDPTT